MFKRKPQVSNLAPLRSSDRRKLADQIIAEYQIPIPATDSSSLQTAPPPLTAESTGPNTSTTATAPSSATSPLTLAAIRNSLLPESSLSARYSTRAGSEAKLVHGTVYVGAHADSEKRVLWFSYGDDHRLYPTVYTIWHNPGLVPLLHTQDFVVDKLQTGADLMTPGLVGGPPWPEKAQKGTVVAVAGLSRHSVPTVVGVCKIDVSSLGRVGGQKGAAVEGIHWEGDNVWAWSQNGAGGRKGPDMIAGWDTLSQNMGALDVNNQNHDEKDAGGAQEEDDDDDDGGGGGGDGGGVALESSTANLPNGSGTNDDDRINQSGEKDEDDDDDDDDDEAEPTTAQIDHSFHQAFLYSLHAAKQAHPAPPYGFDFPIPPSFLISNMVQPFFRHDPTTSKHAGAYTIKKTSWKNAKKFIKHLEKELLLKSKDRNGGETVILDIDFDDRQVKEFVPYRLPKPKVKAAAPDTTDHASGGGSSTTDASLGQKLSLVTVYRASARLVPDLIPSKSTFYTSQQIQSYLKTYVDNNSSRTDPTKVSSKRFVKLDPFLANNVLGSNSSLADTKILAEGEIGRDVLAKRILEDDHLCVPHWVLLPSDQSYDPETSSSAAIKPKPGPAPKVHVTVEKRTGTKLVTKISQLEAFNINPHILGPELQKKCAGSASVGQLVGGKPGIMEILVQGDQREVVKKELARRGVDRRWIEVVDKSTKKK